VNKLRLLIGSYLLSSGIQACEILTYPLQFGIYDGYHEARAHSEVVIANCPRNPFKLSLSAGQHSNNGFSPRQMLGPSGQLFNYNLYPDASYSGVWGDGTQGTVSVQGTEGRYPVYGRAPAYQFLSPGAYSDSVMLVVEW